MDNKLMEAETLFTGGKIEDAEEKFLDLLEEKPEDSLVLNNLGVINHARGNVKEAEDYFLKSLDIKENYFTALLNLANLYFSMREWEKTVGKLEKYISFGNQDYNVFNQLGTVYLELGNNEKARQALSKSLEINPDQEIVRDSLNKLGPARSQIQIQSQLIDDALIKKEFEQRSDKPILLAEAEKHFNKENLEFIKQNCRKILIVMDEGIGNMVMLTPTIKAIKEKLPESKITILGRQPSVQVFEGWDFVEKIMTGLDDEEYDIGFLSIWSKTYELQFGERINAQCKIVFRLEMDNVDTHESQHHLKIARFLGFESKIPGPLCISKEVDIQLPSDKKIVALSDTAQENGAWERKRWPYYNELSKKLIDKGYTVVLIGGNEESSRFNISEWPSQVINCLGKYDVQETSGILKKCDMFIGNDSGPAHIAAALGITTFVLFGPTRISKNKPLGSNIKVITKDLPCSPCQYTQRWNNCNKWKCMSQITVDDVLQTISEKTQLQQKNKAFIPSPILNNGPTKKVLPLIIDKEKPKLPDIHLGRANDRLKLVGKDYSNCSIVSENNIKYLVHGNVKEPLRIHLVGAGRSNYPWGMENEIKKALKFEGIEVVETDYRLERENFTERFMREAHFMLVCKGSGIHPELIRRYPGRTLLWYQDDVFATQHAPRDLAFNGRAFDTVYTFDKSAIEEYRKFGIKDVRWQPLAMSPTLHRKMNVAKKYDVGFVGNIHPNRRPFFERLAKRFNLFVASAFMDEMVQIINQSKIVLNLGIGPTGIQQRVFEVLGSGAFLLTNEIPKQDRLFEDRKHLVYFNEKNIEELIVYYLTHDEEREAIALAGYREAHARHTFVHRMEKMLIDQGLIFRAGIKVMKQDQIDQILKQGEGFFSSGNVERAKECFNQILTLDAKHSTAYNNLGVIAFQQKELGQAKSLFLKVLSIDENNSEAVENLAKCYEAKKDYDEAIKLYTKALNLNRNSTQILNSLGNCFIQLEDVLSARDVYEKSLQLDNKQEVVKALLSEINNLAEAKDLDMTNYGEKSKMPTQKKAVSKVLCYSPYNMWVLHGLWEMTVLHALKLRGADVHYVLCDGLYTECDMFNRKLNQRNAMSCNKCQAVVAKLMEQMGMPFQWLGRYLMPADFKEAKQWSDSIAVENFVEATYNDWKVGDWVRGSVHSNFRMSELDMTIPLIQEVFRNYLYSGLIACFGLSRLLEDYKPDVMFMFNGRRSSTRVAFELAQRAGVRVVIHERGVRKDCVKIKQNSIGLSLKQLKQSWKDWGDVPLRRGELDCIDKLLKEREYGKNFNWISHSPLPQKLEWLCHELKLSRNHPIWLLATTSDDETVGHEEWQTVFPRHNDWVVTTVNYAKRHPELNLVIRVHPNTGGKQSANKNIQQLNFFESLSKTLPNNVRLIMPDDEISTYSLIELATVGLVFHSTVGLEMACRGKMVVAAAGSYVSDIPIVKTVTSVESYEPLLDQLLSIAPGKTFPDIKRMAYRYAYGFFFRNTISFPLVKMINPHQGQLAYNSLEALLPGRDKSLDRISRIVLEGEPACPPPTESDISGSDEELNWFKEKEEICVTH